MNSHEHVLRFASRYQCVPELLAWLDHKLAPACDHDRYFDVRAAIVEAVHNIIRHGLKEDPGHHITVALRLGRADISIDLEDDGFPIPSEKLEKIRLPEFSVDDLDKLPESGFGLGMVAQAVDRISYRSSEGRNRLSLGVDRTVPQ